MPRIRKITIAFLAAVGATALLASVFSTQVVIHGLAAIDVEVRFPTRIAMTFSDLLILATLLPAAAACFLPAFPLARWLAERTNLPRTFWFMLAGASAFLVELALVEAVMGLMPIGGARTPVGMALQGVAGAAGGWVFARLTAPREAGA